MSSCSWSFNHFNVSSAVLHFTCLSPLLMIL
nr:MAG TPA: hypothetical protein [Caudoviricetes sp.]